MTEQPKRISKNYPWILVALLFGVAMLNYMDRQMIATMRPAMQADIEELKLAANFGRLMAIFLWVYGAMSSFSGLIADRVNRKWLIIGSLFIWSSVTAAMGFAENFQQLYWLRALMGFSEAMYFPAGLALIADYHSDKTRSLAIGIHLSGVYMGQALGGFGSTVADLFSWQYSFMSFGMIGIIYSVILILFLKDQPPLKKVGSGTASTSVLKSLGSLFGSFSFYIIILYFAVPSLPGWAIKNWAPTLISDHLNIEMSVAGPLATISISISSFVGVIFGGYISDRWFQKHVRGRIYTGAIGLSLTIPALLLLGFSHSVFPIITSAVLFGFGFGMFDCNNMPILCQFVKPNQRATGYGILNTAGLFAGAIVTDYLGKSTDAGNLGRDFAMLAGVVVIVLIIQLVFLRPKPNPNNF